MLLEWWGFIQRAPGDVRNQDNWLTLHEMFHCPELQDQEGGMGLQGPPSHLHRGSSLLSLDRESLLVSLHGHAAVQPENQPSCVTLAAARKQKPWKHPKTLTDLGTAVPEEAEPGAAMHPPPTCGPHPGLLITVRANLIHALLIFPILEKSSENKRSVHLYIYF